MSESPSHGVAVVPDALFVARSGREGVCRVATAACVFVLWLLEAFVVGDVRYVHVCLFVPAFQLHLRARLLCLSATLTARRECTREKEGGRKGQGVGGWGCMQGRLMCGRAPVNTPAYQCWCITFAYSTCTMHTACARDTWWWCDEDVYGEHLLHSECQSCALRCYQNNKSTEHTTGWLGRSGGCRAFPKEG